MSPRWRLLLLFAVIAPFFTTYLIRTIAWKTILADDSPIVDVLKFLGIVPDDGRVLATSGAVIAGLTYNFLPFMILPIYASLERIDLSLIEAGKDLYASARQAFLRVTLPLTMPGDRRRRPAHASSRRSATTSTPSSSAARTSAMIGNKIQSLYLERARLPRGRRALVPDDGRGPDRRARLHPRSPGPRRSWAQRTRRTRRWRRRPSAARPSAVAAPSRAWSWLRRRALNIYAALAVAYMLVPIAVIAVFSFVEAPANRDRLDFTISDGFTLEYWQHAFSLPDLNEALITSL